MRRFRLSAYVSALLLAAGFALTGAAEAQASPQLAITGGYVSLGDSYASGVGAGNYISTSGSCDRSTNAHPYTWNAAHHPASFAFNACSGATTDDVMANQLGSLNSSTGLVSVTVGGNDAGFSDVMMTCVVGSDSDCVNRINTAKAYINNTLPGKLNTVYSAVRGRAPSARVVVLGYPRFYKLNVAGCVGLSETKRSAINSAADTIDGVIQNRAAAYGFVFGDVRTTFAGHELCTGDDWLHSVDWGDFGQSYHPTALGQNNGYLPVLTNAAG
ncbi:SGNH/GDSL hydrolase family protein [Streptomyces sp. V3I7]|uniref:SGNH/GDSL hydrolase family protein n=1 Tax=Streptomyces sp. V3I7 TaxID=3042278 RepID=UPI0027848799|nr:SGNH/GDSL hydrolase family protein [Streptomyces sp. V3I7]MDQ0990040.1 lysophospholipase L1-like esterase [Streptomyces sp. V3I7]